ncbi:protein C19orf12 isoform X1 [Bombus terrestris]|uniref:Protein C19orf12 isoform X1 n=2 Tax=Bombus terrestris TaxID=30195 RepID=A0A6P3U9T8_BOMTE|nr:protein C19orf12 isoform X1 [Bombus terrestris]XP_012171318.1 protein C19orf12 isoform X1 [Bombus terrestris]
MDFPTDELLKEVLQYPAVQSMKVTVSSCGKYAVIIGGSAFLGGLIGGPIGLAVVGTVVSALSAFFGYHEIKSVPYIILYETTPEQREKLALSIVKYLNLKNIWSLRDLLYYNKEELALGITSIIVKFVTHDMRYSMRN